MKTAAVRPPSSCYHGRMSHEAYDDKEKNKKVFETAIGSIGALGALGAAVVSEPGQAAMKEIAEVFTGEELLTTPSTPKAPAEHITVSLDGETHEFRRPMEGEME